MITFREFHNLNSQLIQEGLLLEGKYLSLVKHFIVNLYHIRKISHDTAELNRRARREIDAAWRKGEEPPDEFKKWVNKMGNDTNFLTRESRGHIANLPDYYQPMLKDLVEKISGEPIGEFDPEVAERFFGWNCYKKFFKLYVLNFVLESLILESMVNETNFDMLMAKIEQIYKQVDSMSSSEDVPSKIKHLLSLAPKIISIVGKLTQISAKGFE